MGSDAPANREKLRAAIAAPREGEQAATPETRADAILAKIPAFNSEGLIADFQGAIQEPLAHLKEAIAAARADVASYNASVDVEETVDADKAREGIRQMEACYNDLFTVMQDFFNNARRTALSQVLPEDEALQASVLQDISRELPTEQFNGLLNTLIRPVLILQKRHLSSDLEIHAATDKNANTFMDEITGHLNVFVTIVDVKAREALKAKLLAEFAAEEKRQKAVKAMKKLNRRITLNQGDFVGNPATYSANGVFERASAGVREIMHAAMGAFAELGGLSLKEDIKANLETILSSVRFDPSVFAKYQAVTHAALPYDTDELRVTSIGALKYALAASAVAEAKKESLQGFLSAMIGAFQDANLADYFDGDLSNVERLAEVRTSIATVIHTKLSAAIAAQFVREINEIEPFDTEALLLAVLARVEARLAGLAASDQSQPVEEVDVEFDDDDSDGVAMPTAGSVRDKAPGVLGLAIDAEDAADDANPNLTDTGLWTRRAMKAGSRENAKTVPVVVPAASVVEPPLESSFSERTTEVPAVPRTATPIGLIPPGSASSNSGAYAAAKLVGVLGLFGVTGAATVAGLYYGASRFIEAQEAWRASSAEPAPAVPSVWSRYNGEYPANDSDKGWVIALAGVTSDADIPVDLGALALKCKDGKFIHIPSVNESWEPHIDLVVHAPESSFVEETLQVRGRSVTVQSPWKSTYTKARGFEALSSVDEPAAVCAEQLNGVFIARLVPEATQ